MEEKEVKGCNGRCEMCNVNQRTYCAAQMAYYNQQEIAEIKAILSARNNESEETIILCEKAVQNVKESEMSEYTEAEGEEKVKIQA